MKKRDENKTKKQEISSMRLTFPTTHDSHTSNNVINNKEKITAHD